MFERLLEPGCTESPACQCGGEMRIATIEILPQGSDAAVRIYRCDDCEREMRLTVWAAPPFASEWPRFLGRVKFRFGPPRLIVSLSALAAVKTSRALSTLLP